jgi:hypothetical protein
MTRMKMTSLIVLIQVINEKQITFYIV